MSARLLTRSVLAATLAVAGTSSQGLAQRTESSGAQRAQTLQSGNACVQRIYPVADLVLPIPESTNVSLDNLAKLTEFDKKSKQTTAPTTRHDDLIKLLVATVEPESWSARGGPATLAYDAMSMTLVVNATPTHQEKIASILAGLRGQQDAEVALEVRIISVAEPFLERIGVDFNAPPGKAPAASAPPGTDLLRNAVQGFPQVIFLSDVQVFQFLEAAQGDPRTNVLQAPKITMFNGQTTNFSSAEMQYFVTNVEKVQAGGSVIFVPRNEPMPVSGFYFSAQPAISADRRFVNLNFKANLTSLVSTDVPLFPVTTMITPHFEGGSEGTPVPFTQFLQQPRFNTMTVERRLNLPDGGTALLSGWRRVSEARNEFGPPVLSKIPYINRLFKNVGYDRGTEHVMLMVTPRIILNPAAEGRAVQADQATKVRAASLDGEEQETLASLMEKYRQACTEGRLADAKVLAGKALALDPTCFSKK